MAGASTAGLAAAVPADVAKARLRLAVTLATLIQAGIAWSLFIFPPIALAASAALGIDPLYVGVQGGTIFFCTIFATLYSGRVIGLIGPVRALGLAMLLVLAGISLAALHNIPAILLGAVCFGLSHSLTNPSTAVILKNFVSDSNRGVVFSIKQCSVPLGLLAASLVGPFIAERFDWRFAMLPLAVLQIVLLCLLPRLQRLLPAAAKRELPSANLLQLPLRALRALWANRPLRYTACVGLSFGMCQGAILTYTSNLFAVERDFSLSQAGFILMCAHVGGIIGRISWGYLADRLQSPVLVMRTLAVLIATALLLLSMLPAGLALGWWLLLYLFLGGFAVGWNGVVISEFAYHARGPDMEEQLAGSFCVLFCGGAFSPWLFALVYLMVDSYATVMGMFGVCFGFLGLALLLRLGRERHHHVEVAPEVDL